MARIVVLLLALGGAAHAEPRQEARQHFDAGRERYDKGQYTAALAEFEKAYAIAPIPDLLFNIARCREKLGDFAGAATDFRRYLAASSVAADRVEIARHVGDLEQRIAALEAQRIIVVPPPAPKSRRGLWIGIGVGSAVVVGVVLGVGLGVGLSGGKADLTFPGAVLR